MAGDAANPRIWQSGDVYYGAIGTTAPTDTTTALNAAYKAVGLLSEDGVTEAREEDSNDYYAWGSILVRTVRSRHRRSFSFVALENNKDLWVLLNPGSATPVTATGTTTRIVKVPTPNPQAFVFHMVDGTNIRRIVIPRGEVTEVGDTVMGQTDMEMREITVTVYADSTGVLYREITNDAQAVVP
jgi:hypothetical protein